MEERRTYGRVVAAIAELSGEELKMFCEEAYKMGWATHHSIIIWAFIHVNTYWIDSI